MNSVEDGTGNHRDLDDADQQLMRVRKGLAPTRRIYRNYAWGILLASILILLWGYFTVENKKNFLHEDYFDEAGTMERYGVSIILAEQSVDLPFVERWLLGHESPEQARSGAIEYLKYADGEDLLTENGEVMLACLYWSSGNEMEAKKIVELLPDSKSLYADALKELMAGRALDDYTWNELQERLRYAPRDWVTCFLAGEALELRQKEGAGEMRELIEQRRQNLLMTSAKIAVLDWLVFLTGVGCIIVIVRRFWRSGDKTKTREQRLTRLWPLSWVLIIFVLGDFLAGWVAELMWVGYENVLLAIPYTFFSIAVDIVFRGMGTVLFLWFFFRRPKYVFDTLLRPVPQLWQWVFAAFTTVWLIDIIWYDLSSGWFSIDKTVGYQWNEYGWEGLVTSMVSGVVLAPFFEEFVFRGLLFNGLKNRLGLHLAAVVSAILFAGVHFYGTQDIIAVGLFGLVMAYLYHLTRSLWPCILCHALFNFLITLWDWVVMQSPVELWGIG